MMQAYFADLCALVVIQEAIDLREIIMLGDAK